MKRIGFVVFPGFQILDLAALTEFEMANRQAPHPRYDIRLLSEHGGAVVTSAGIAVETQPFARANFDTLIVMGDLAVAEPSLGLTGFVRKTHAKSRRTAAICTGAFVLAAAGVLDGHRATTHWLKARELQRRYPQVKVEEDRIFIADDGVWTSAGMAACIDLASPSSRTTSAANSRARLRATWSSTIGAAAASHNSPRCSNSIRNPTAFRAHYAMRGTTCARRFRSRSWLRSRI